MVVTPAEVAADHAGLLFGRGRVQRPELVQADGDRGVTGTGPPLGRRRSQTAPAGSSVETGSPWSAGRPRAAGFDAGAGRSWPSTWSPRGWSPRGWSTIISHQGLRLLLGQEGGSVQRVQSAEDLDRPERRDQEEPGARAVCDRRRPSGGPVPVTPRSPSAWTSSGR